jgi:hypothetical protein
MPGDANTCVHNAQGWQRGRTCGVAMRLVATGPTPRGALAVIVYDATQPPTTRMEIGGPQLVSCQ